jgi:hypothetical protein
MGLIEIVKDDFTAGTILEQFAGNGSFNFPGTTAELICPNSVNCDWDYNSGPYAPVLWASSEGRRSERRMAAVFETKMNSFVRTTNLALAGITVFPEIGLPQSFFYMAYYANESKIIVDRQYGSGATRLYSSGAVPDPATTPHFYRVYSNKSERSLYVPETDTVLSPNTIGFAFSTDGGSTWTMAHTRTIDLNYFRAGVFNRKWATGASDNATATFEYFYAEQYSEEDQALVSSGGIASFEDRIEFPPTGGESRGSVGQEHGDVRTLPGAAFEDQIELPDGGGEARHQVLNLEPGVVQQAAAVGFSEEIDVEVYEGPDYMENRNDSDGTEFLQGPQTRALLALDLTADLFHTHASGFYGTARDGKNYYDGEECTPTGPEGTSFGTVASGPNRRCWSIWHGAPPMEDQDDATLALSIPSDDVLRMVGTAMVGLTHGVLSMWYLSGDFDIQAEWSNWSDSGGSDGGVGLFAMADQSNLFYSRRRISGGVAENGRLDKDVKINGSYGGNYSFVDAAGVTSGWFRLVRSGSVVSSYYGTPGSWTQIGSSIDMGRAEPMYVGMLTFGTGTANVAADVTNFSITAGTVINTAAWAREAKSDHRGNTDEFPTRPLFVATDNTLEIIDPENDLMWMRFLEGTSNAIDPNWAGTDQWVHDLAFSQGVTLLAYHGALVRIDFNLSDIRIGRLLTDANRGARKKNTHGFAYDGWRNLGSNTNSHIVVRNGGDGFGEPSLDAWQVDSRDVNSVDLWHAAGYEYRAIASASGLRMHKWRRWYFAGTDEEGIKTPDWSVWDTANAVFWCRLDKTSGELFWMDDTNMYSAPQGGGTGWEDRFDESPFSAVTTKALPGTREYFTKWMFVRYGNYLFTPADEGIYRVNWPSGSWELFYGNAASAATHKILPNYSFPTCLALGADGATPILVVGMLDGTAVIDLSDDSLHSQTPTRTGQLTQVVAA